MSMKKCATIKCQHYVREGLRRFGTGVDGQELADGRFCWRCRARHASRVRVDRRRDNRSERKGDR
jgi:hypothetical protein